MSPRHSPAAAIPVSCREAAEPALEGARGGAGGSTGSSRAGSSPFPTALLASAENGTEGDGRGSREREPCPGHSLQLALPGVIHEARERRGCFHPQDICSLQHFLSHTKSLSARGSAGLKMQKCASCSLFSKVISPTLGLDTYFNSYFCTLSFAKLIYVLLFPQPVEPAKCLDAVCANPVSLQVLQQLLMRKYLKYQVCQRKYAEHSKDVFSWACLLWHRHTWISLPGGTAL